VLATENQLRNAAVLHTAKGHAAVVIASRLASPSIPAAAVAALSKELGRAIASALAAAPSEDELDELERRRLEKAGEAH
jgi:hypothetical protein